jgi:hypothetical protein
VKRSLQVCGGALALLASAATILTVIFPGWGGVVPTRNEPQAYGAEILVTGIEPDISLDAYLPTAEDRRREAGTDETRSFTDVELGWPGALVNFTVKIQRYEGRACRLTWTLFTATGSRVQDERFMSQPVFPVELVIPRAQEDQINLELWFPYPNLDGDFIVRITLTDDEGDALDVGESEVITIG